MWLHILVGPYWCMFLHCSEVDAFPNSVYCRTVQHTHTNKDPLIYAATSSHTDVLELAILTTVTLANRNNALPDDGVTAPKHVGAVLM